ncbi:hypothetical protein B296_00036716, partial [Ensete ventricosum]
TTRGGVATLDSDITGPSSWVDIAREGGGLSKPKEERKEVEARVVELSSQLAQTHIQVEEANQCIKEECREANSLASELALELNLALHCAEQAKAQVKEARDEAAMVEDIAVKSITEGEHQYEAHHRELKDAHWQLGKAIKESRQLKEWLSANSDELLDACLAIEEITIGCFKARYPELNVDKDPYAELPSDAQVPALVKVPFDDRSTSPLALPPLA